MIYYLADSNADHDCLADPSVNHRVTSEASDDTTNVTNTFNILLLVYTGYFAVEAIR